MKGIIITNPFEKENHQAKRLKEEFEKKGVRVEIVSNGWELATLETDKIQFELKDLDFAAFLDKNKYLSDALEKSGIKLFNSHQGVRVCDDKGETCLALSGKGVKMPKTIFAPLCYIKGSEITLENAKQVASKLGLPVIVKESYGSLGKGVYKADTNEELLALMQKLIYVPHVYQEYLGKMVGVDIRVILIGKKVVCAMKRTNKNDFRSNLACGGSGEKIELSKEFLAVAERTAEILDLDYCGVDLLFGDDYSPYVCEVNSNAFFKGIENVTGENVAEKYAQYIIEKIKNHLN
jgi:RimK family alpha-L-glutamate ligase